MAGISTLAEWLSRIATQTMLASQRAAQVDGTCFIILEHEWQHLKMTGGVNPVAIDVSSLYPAPNNDICCRRPPRTS